MRSLFIDVVHIQHYCRAMLYFYKCIGLPAKWEILVDLRPSLHSNNVLINVSYFIIIYCRASTIWPLVSPR